ncbi:MAG: hypothetical protein V3V00_07810 [Saprospiraceae bacterium]
MKIKIIDGNLLNEISEEKTSEVMKKITERLPGKRIKNIFEEMNILVAHWGNGEGLTTYLLEIRRYNYI